MKTSDQLFELIHALSKSEKRHFKIYSSLLTGNKTYLKLFDLIEKQKEYDEVKLKLQLKIKGFPVIKIYLYNLILKSLRIANNHENERKSSIEQFENAENLLQKGLYKQSSIQLQKAKKIAEKLQYFPLLIEIYQLEHVIANSSLDTLLLKKLRDTGNIEINGYLSALKEQSEYRKGINIVTYRYNQRGKILRNTEEKNDVVNEISELLSKNPETCLSFKSKVFHYNLSELYYYSTNNFQEAYNQSNRALLHFESDLKMLNHEVKNYINSMNNLMNALQDMKRYPEMMNYINRMKNIPLKEDVERIRVFAFCASRQIIYYTFTGQIQEGILFIRKIESEISNYKDRLNHPALFAMCNNIIEFYFLCSNFKEALRWNNKLIYHPKIKLHQHYYSNALLTEIILHFELENIDTYESLINSYQLFINKNERKGAFEPTFLKYIKLLSKTTDEKNKEEIYKEFLDRIRDILSNPYEFGTFDIFDIEVWLLSKKEKKQFREYYVAQSGK